jgi:prepilin peptidase CpaA
MDITLVFAMCLAVLFDVKERRIPNWLSIPGIVIGLLLNSLLGFAQLLHGVLGVVVAVAILIVPFALGWLGAGDVKLFGLVGAFLGVQWLPRVLFYTGLASGGLALFSIIARGFDYRRLRNLWTDLRVAVLSLGQVLPASVTQRTVHANKAVPWGVAIGLGTLAAVYLDAGGNWAGF